MGTIEFCSVGFTYPNGVKALSALNFVIPKGDFVFLLGPSGAGKSTTLKMIYRQLKPTLGEVWVNGLNVGKLRPGKIPALRRRLGVVFQDFKLLHGRTVFQNVAYALEVLGEPLQRIRSKAWHALSLVGLTHKAQNNVEHLSHGEQQRTAIARAISNDAGILMADEPTGHLDYETGCEIMQIFENINREGATVLIATNNLAWPERLRKKTIFLSEGESVENFSKGASLHGYPNDAVFSS